MKINLFLPLLLFSFSSLLTACLDNEDSFQATTERDEELIINYLQSNSLTATETPNGIYVVNQRVSGSGVQVQPESILYLDYSMKLLDGTLIESSDYTFSPAIGAFLLALPEASLQFEEGDEKQIIIPSRLAFGAGSGQRNGIFIPANSILILDIKMNDVRTEADQNAIENQIFMTYLDSLGLTTDSVTANGVIQVVLEQGEGTDTPNVGSNFIVAYEGRFLGGEVFDSSNEFAGTLDPQGLINGWVEGLRLMKLNEKALILIPSLQGYGGRGNQAIPPYEPLVFEITLNSFN